MNRRRDGCKRGRGTWPRRFRISSKSPCARNRNRRIPYSPRASTSASSAPSPKTIFSPTPTFRPGRTSPSQTFASKRRTRRTSISDCREFPIRFFRMAVCPGANANSPAQEPGGDHSCVVHDDQFVAAQEVRTLAKRAVLPRAGAPVEQQHPRSVPLIERPLRDSFRRQVVVEFREQHRIPKHVLAGARSAQPRQRR
jgi:hypothetical protein